MWRLHEHHVRTSVAMVRSAIDQREQAQLVEFFAALEPALSERTRLAEAVTFWRHQLIVGVEPSHLTELMAVLDEVAERTEANADLRARAAEWLAVLAIRAQPVEPWRTPSGRK
jgi:hypothetical protein